DLLERARSKEEALLPVVLNLSSWANRQLSLEQWVVEELRMRYDIPSSIGKVWVETHQLLLMLDGLDEVAPGAQLACIEAMNKYYRQAHRSLVICSRTKDYLNQPGRLALLTTVVIQALTSQQVDDYLSVLG